MASASSDIFKSFEFVNGIQKKFYPSEEDSTLAIGLYGAEAELFGRTLQTAIRIASETSNEAIPTKAKYDRNIITHAHYVGIDDINAIPSTMDVSLYFPMSQLNSKLIDNKFIFDKNIKIMIGEDDQLEFHTDYDIIITRNRIGPGKYIYTAIYDIDRVNPISKVTSAYLPPVGIINTADGEFIVIRCTIRQVQYEIIPRKVLTDNVIENKTFTFTFQDQLADFDIRVVEGTSEVYLTPVYDGSINDVGLYCEYSFIDTNNIRIKFNRDSYMPSLNADVYINLKLTKGAGGDFECNSSFMIDMDSERFNYTGMYAMIYPITNSENGIDKKTIEDIKKEIPKEALTRGTIITTTDLDNFFNSINSNNSKMYFYKKKYNMIDHIYYAYLLMKYMNNIVPSNTIDIVVKSTDAHFNGNGWVINPMTTFVLDGTEAYIDNTITESGEHPFVYYNPFMLVINKNPLMISSYLTTFSTMKYLDFSYINQSTQVQFISSHCNVDRSAITDTMNYHISLELMQNINQDFGLISYNEDDSLNDENIKVFIVFYASDSAEPYRYIEGDLINYDSNEFRLVYDFTISTDDIIDSDNRIKLTNLKQPSSGLIVDSYIENDIKATIYIMSKLDKVYGSDNIYEYIPGLEAYSICNKYGIQDGLQFFYNYTQMMATNPILKVKDDGSYDFHISKIPMIRKQYLNNEIKMKAIIKEIQKRRQYLEFCLLTLEDGFDIDFKFFNTYGPSIRFVDKDDNYIDKVNLTLNFETELLSNAENYVLDMIADDIKEAIENINSIEDLHMSNLCSDIRVKYKDQLKYFEFLGFNKYGPGEQYIKNIGGNLFNDVPEFLNINTLANDAPDIYINGSLRN